MTGSDEKIRRARELLAQERADVLAALAAACGEAQKIAEAQKAWREAVVPLLERADTAGVSVNEMAAALGLSRQWTSHLRADAKRRERLEVSIVTAEAMKRRPRLPPH